MPRSVTRVPGLLALAAGLASSAGVAYGQDHTADPYKPYNNQYQQFVYPSAPSNLALPGQARIYRETADGTFEERTRELDLFRDEGESIFERSPSSSAGVPYYRAYRQYDKDYGRISSAGKGETRYQRDREQIVKRRRDAAREKDPRKRAELLRAIDRDELKAFRTANDSRNLTPDRLDDSDDDSEMDSGDEDAGSRAARSGSGRTSSSASRARRSTAVPPMIASPSRPSSNRQKAAVSAKAADTARNKAEAKPAPRRPATPDEILERSERSTRKLEIPPPPPID